MAATSRPSYVTDLLTYLQNSQIFHFYRYSVSKTGSAGIIDILPAVTDQAKSNLRLKLLYL